MPPRLPYSYIDPKSINTYLLCSVCETPMVDPVTAEDNRSGCRACFDNQSSSQSLTPILERIVLDMLNGLLVQCKQCEETNIRRGHFKEHQEKSCRRAIVPCNAADIKCPWKGEREQLEEHMDTCKYEQLRPALAAVMAEHRRLKEQLDQCQSTVHQIKERKLN